MAGVHERNTYEEIGIRSDNGKIVINGGSVTASGGNKAITTKEEEASAGNNDITTVKNAIPGTGWTDVEGTVGETAIPVNTEGQSVKAYKKVQFLQPPDPAPTPVSTTALTAVPTAAPTATPNPVPKTGDSANPVLWLGLILLGLAGISGLAVSKVRK